MRSRAASSSSTEGVVVQVGTAELRSELEALAARSIRGTLAWSGGILLLLGVADALLGPHGDATQTAGVYLLLGGVCLALSAWVRRVRVPHEWAFGALFGIGLLTLGGTAHHLAVHPVPVNGLPMMAGTLAASVLVLSRR